MEQQDECTLAFLRLGLTIGQMTELFSGKSVAFNLAWAAEGSIAVAQFAKQIRLRLGIYTLKNEGGGLMDFMAFESKGRAAVLHSNRSQQ